MIEIDPSADLHQGYHAFKHGDDYYGSFEVFYHERQCGDDKDDGDDGYADGWYWSAGFPGCLHDGDWSGPFTSSQEAFQDARSTG